MNDTTQRSPKSSGWTSKITNKIKRLSHGSFVETNSQSRGPSLEQDRIRPTQNYFATDNVLPTGRGNDISMETDKSLTSECDSGHSEVLRTTKSRSTSPEEIIGLDQSGRARRRSSATNSSPTLTTSNDTRLNQDASLYNRPVVDTSSQNHNAFDGDLSPSKTRTVAVKRKEVPSPTSESTGPDLPIYSQFASQNASPTELAAGAQAAKLTALEKANAILNNNTIDTSKTDDQLQHGLQKMTLQQSRDGSRSSYESAHERRESHSGERCTDLTDQEHPSAQEIIDRSKYNSTDTTIHNKTVPAVTHETIIREVHEIKQEQITRDVHHHHHIHRIMPVHEVEVLPARHYRLENGMKIEMRPEEVATSRVDAWQSAIIPKIET